MITIYVSFKNIIENSDTDKILIDGTFSVKAENGRYILYFEHLEDDQYILKRVKDTEKDISYNNRSKKYNLKDIDLQTSCGAGSIISFKVENIPWRFGDRLFFFPSEKVYLEPSEKCHFKYKQSIVYLVENRDNKYYVKNVSRDWVQVNPTKEIMEKIVLVEKPKKTAKRKK